MTPPNLVIPYVLEHNGRGLRSETRAFGERLGARFVEMTTPASYWELFEELWTAEGDFIVLEEDVLPPTAELVEHMWACTEPWCTGTFGRWNVTQGGGLWSDAQLGLVKFGSIRRVVPEALVHAANLFPARHWTEVAYGLGLCSGRSDTHHPGHISPHLHLPHAVHLREEQRYEDPWDTWEDSLAALLHRVGIVT